MSLGWASECHEISWAGQLHLTARAFGLHVAPRLGSRGQPGSLGSVTGHSDTAVGPGRMNYGQSLKKGFMV